MSTKTKLSTIQCPKCGQTLPGWAQKCQFCGAEISPGYARPVDAYKYKIDNRISWKEAAYYIVAVLVVAQGAYFLLLAFNVISNDFYKIGGGTFFGVIGAIRAFLGIGMLTHQTWAQFILKWMFILASFGDGLGLLRTMMLGDGAVAIALSLLWLLIDGFAVYLINEEGDV